MNTDCKHPCFSCIGDDLAAKLEAAMKKPPGWMDVDHDTQAYGAGYGPNLNNHHRLISWEQVGKKRDKNLSENEPPLRHRPFDLPRKM